MFYLNFTYIANMPMRLRTYRQSTLFSAFVSSSSYVVKLGHVSLASRSISMEHKSWTVTVDKEGDMTED